MILLEKVVEKEVFKKVCLGGIGEGLSSLGVLAEALRKCCGEGCSSTLVKKGVIFLIFYG